MPLSTLEAFQKHQIVRDDGVPIIYRERIHIAGLEAGYNLPSAKIKDEVSCSEYPGQLTCEKFLNFCEKNKDFYLSPEDMARSVVVIAPSNIITRASLEKIFEQSSSTEHLLSEKEIDELFNILDTEHKGAFTADHFMQALYGDEGSLSLAEERANDVLKAQRLKREEEEAKANTEREEAERKHPEESLARSKPAAEFEPLAKKKKAKSCC